MKRLFLLIVTLLSLAGCNMNGSTHEVYFDTPSFKDGDIEFTFKDAREQKLSDSYSLSFEIEIINRNAKAKEINLNKSKLIRESNKAEYSVTSYYVNPVKLECDLKETLLFHSSIPVSIKDEKYMFEIKYDSKQAIVYFYNKPEEKKKDVEIQFVVDGQKVEKRKVKEGTMAASYNWVNKDGVYGCAEWYFDKEFLADVPKDYRISNPVTLYGEKTSVLKYQLPDKTSSSFVSGYNFVPNSGEIVVPKSFNSRNLYGVLAGSFNGACSGLKAIYIPKTITTISASYNFSSCEDLEYVYFEGNENEWAKINEATFPSKTQIVFNTYTDK